MRTRNKILSYFIVSILFLSSGYLIGVYSNGGPTPTIDPTGIRGFPWLNATTGINAPEFYLNSEDKTDLLAYPEQVASYIIFKSGSSYYAKNGSTGQIDYSGSNATTIIQTAIDYVEGIGGGSIFFGEGTFTITATLTIPVGNVRIHGAGRASIILLVDNADVPMINIAGDNIEISDMTLDGNKAHQGVEQSCITVSGASTHTWFINNYFIDCNGDAIETRGNYGIIAGNYVENPWEDSFHIHGSHWKILDNYIYGSNGRINFWADEVTPSDILISGNTFENLTDAGIYIGWGGNPTNRVTVSDNSFIECDRGILIGDDGGSEIIIKNNIMRLCEKEGIKMLSTNPVTDLQITDNTILDNSQEGDHSFSAINLVSEAAVLHSDWIVSDNIIKSTGSPRHRYGIRIGGVSGTLNRLAVESNIISLSEWAGVQISVTLVGISQKIKYNIGFITENSGTQICSDNENIAHGLAKTPTEIQVTPMNDTYDGKPIIVTVDWVNVDGTNIRVGLYWVNGTAITDDIILVSWRAEYDP